MGNKITEQNNFYYLTVALIILLVSSSLDQVLHITWLDKIMQGITLLTFVVCLVSLRFDSGWYRFLLSLAVTWIALVIIKELLDFKQIDIAMLVLMLSFFFGTFKSIMRQILFTGSIDNNKVVGSLALFLYYWA